MIRKDTRRGEGLLRLIAYAAGIVALSFALTWPLWSLATGNRLLYTELSGSLVFLLCCYAALRGPIRACAKRARRRPSLWRRASRRGTPRR